MESFLIKYGLIAVFFGAMFEGDLVIPMAGALSSFGYFEPWLAGGVCIAGMFAGDCLWYVLGRRFGKRLEGTKFYKRAMPKAEKFAEKMGIWQIAAARFIWGIRIATMIFWGFKRLNFFVFAAIDLAACTVFTSVLLGLGYFFSRGLKRLVGDVEQLQVIALVGIVAIMAAAIVIRKWKHT